MRDVNVEGVSEPPSAGQLVNATKFDLGQPFRRQQVQQATDTIMDNLRLNGLYQAKVSSEITPVNVAEQIDLLFNVDPGQRARYNTPVVKGSDLKKTPENIIDTARWRKFLLKSWREVTENRTTQGIDRIRRSYQKKDYLMARVQLDQMAYDPSTNLVTPHISIAAGPKVRIVTEGAKVSRGKLEQLIPVYQEQAVDKDLLTEGRRNLLQYLEGKGYFEADVEYSIREQAPRSKRSFTMLPSATATSSRLSRSTATSTSLTRPFVSVSTSLRQAFSVSAMGATAATICAATSMQ